MMVMMPRMIFLLFATAEVRNKYISEGYEINICPPFPSTTVHANVGEHARLRCRLCNGSSPINLSDLQTHGFTISWFKSNFKSGLMELLDNGNRIAAQWPFLGFWPAFVNDTGRYFCSLFNGTHNISGPNVSLEVIPISEGCYSEELEYTRNGYIGLSVRFDCPDVEEYKHNTKNLKWYKNCQEEVATGSPLDFHSLGEENAGHYTCVLSIEHYGRQYNVTRTVELKLKEAYFEPKLIYPGQEHIEVTLGERRVINCTVLAGHKSKQDVMLTWKSQQFKIPACKLEAPVCKGKRSETIKDNRVYVEIPLEFTKVKEEHLNHHFNCTLHGSGIMLTGSIFLQEKGKSAAPHSVGLLFFAIVVLFILACVCAYFKVQIALCFRDLTGRDETRGDNKEYDAYVLLLKNDDTLLNTHEEQKFAFKSLPETLEKTFGYRLCIFERDVAPGVASAESILLYINKCRRLIIILSKEYVDDHFSSTYELMTGLHQVLVEGKIKPILIQFKPINNTKSLPESLQLVLKSKGTVKWEEGKNSYFWKKLRYLMPVKGHQVHSGNL
ncbi:interleukin-18 receptor 1-like isoform X2 [Hypanus sabinus]|uniref:interleukin-18 receptor 1-like isoform X2 n=1 Tax=Hypanus sabinus TaxID=79690 RepID=UPI0028C42FF7|nr:interleukin-18 receptor 1-like isoform X2 [Hypanus sabinus]XP_059820403.1 interleukin-18 receptor 1-like isoform X2 [Hypanus sabinus]XP_059820404.1 interleukin-18 receptor 1-like isoform X2 [Hypanus sabinus]